MQDEKHFWLLTGKYLAGTIEAEEERDLLRLLEGDVLLLSAFEEAKKIAADWKAGEGNGGGVAGTGLEDALRDLRLLVHTHEKIRAYEAGSMAAPLLPPVRHQGGAKKKTPVHVPGGMRIPGERVPVMRTLVVRWVAAAAVLAGVVAFSWLLWNKMASGRQIVEWASLRVARGQRKKLVLPDSTVVYVNAGSSIEYPQDFSDSTREVRLSGEAFFEVARDTRRPFIVRGGALQVKVLGTSFDLRAYAGDETQTVLVATGKVQVSVSGRVLEDVSPSQLLGYDVKKDNYTTIGQSPEAMDWRQNRMSFRDISFRDLAGELGRRYGKTFVFVNPALEACRFQVNFDNLPLDKILQQLSATTGFSYDSRGDTVLLKGRSCF